MNTSTSTEPSSIGNNSTSRPPSASPYSLPSTNNTAANNFLPTNGSGLMQRSTQYPSTGDQMDMQVLYDLIGNLAEVQQGIREQTQGVLQRVQMIQSRRDVNGVNGEEANGQVNGTTTESNHGSTISQAEKQAYLDEIASLRAQLSSTTTTLNTITTHQNSLQALLSQHELSLSLLLSKLRPYATHHTSALESQKAHYLSLLETERNQNLELRLEMARQQEGMGKVLGWIREAEGEEKGKERKWKRVVAGLRAENRVLRGISGIKEEQTKGVEESSESSSSSEDESVSLGMGIAGPGVVGRRNASALMKQ